MSDLDRIVDVTISRQTQTVAQASFGTFGIVSEFATDKTTVTFARYREYASLAEMTDDGWSTSDAVYKAAAIVFSQNPSVDKIMVGRIDKDDADISTALNEIQKATQDWYMFLIVGTASGKLVFSADFVSLNSIVVTVNGTAVTAVVFDTDQETTMDNLAAQIETDITGASVTVDPLDLDTRTLIIEIDDGDVESLSAVVTLGASQPTATATLDIVDDDIKAAAAWTETQKKIFMYTTGNSDVLDSGVTTDLPYYMKNLSYDRTVSCYHPYAQDAGNEPAWFEAGWAGEALPYDPGSQTWAFKTISGVAVYSLTTAERNAAFGKNCNVYTQVGGVSITEEGKVASGEWIDVIRGIDWIESRLQEAVFTELVNARKIPFTDEGVAVIENSIRGVLSDAADQGIIDKSSIVVSVPKVSTISATDKGNRNLPDVNFSATLQGAIQKVVINGTVTV